MMHNLVEQIRSYVDSRGRHLCWYKHNVESFRNNVLLSDEFAQSQLAHKIINETRFLANGVTLPIRTKAIMKGITQYAKCVVCGCNAHISSSISLSDPFFTKFCDNKACQASYASKCRTMTDECRHSYSTSMKNYKMKLNIAYQKCAQTFHSNEYHLISYDEVCRYANERLTSQKSNGSLISQQVWINDCDLICSIIFHTSFIDLPCSIDSIKDFNMNERLYCLANHMTRRPVCKFCAGPVKFFNARHGYIESCASCSGEKMRLKLYGMTNQEALKLIDTEQYEIIEFDDARRSTDKHLTLKCRKCGAMSKLNLHSRCLNHYIKHGRLCKNCEKYVSQDELKLRGFIRGLVSDDILFNDRTVIAPYELDIYIPSKKFAIEFNGCFWHSVENNVSMKYHLHKTRLCEKDGIKLMHIWEDEWMNDRSKIEKLIKTFISGSYEIDVDSCHYVDRSKFNRVAIEQMNFKIIGEKLPSLVERQIKFSVSYHVPDCGKLIVE